MEISKMKNVFTVIILCAAAIGAPAATKKKTQTPPAPQAITIPKDAVANPDGISYSYTDKQGKKWTYTKTPFGIMKSPTSADSAGGGAPDVSSTKAIDNGETVRFERPGPFGTMSWEKKKADLTDDERRLLDAQTPKTETK
jgi:hypothetical protein